MTKSKDVPSGADKTDRGDASRKQLLRPRMIIVLAAIAALGTAAALFVMWHTQHVLMGVPLLILAIFPVIAWLEVRSGRHDRHGPAHSSQHHRVN